MLTEPRLARNQVLSRSLNDRVALITTNSETFGPLKFMCECGIHNCGERVKLTVGEYQAIRAEPTHFLIEPGHVLEASEAVVEDGGRYVVVERAGAESWM